MIGQIVCPVEVGNRDLILVDVKAAEGAVVEQEPGFHVV